MLLIYCFIFIVGLVVGGVIGFVYKWRNEIKEGTPSASHNTARDAIIRLLDSISAEERASIFGEYCTHCGDKNPRCQCWNDD